jgi:hypothetical protein
VGRGFSPLDEERAVLPGTLAPRQQRHLVHLGRSMPCRHASRVLQERLGVSVSPETARRLCEDVGRQMEDTPTAAAREPWKEETEGREKPSRLAMSAGCHAEYCVPVRPTAQGFEGRKKICCTRDVSKGGTGKA